MRVLFVLPTVLLATSIVIAQQGATPAQDTAQLDMVLAGWEKTLTSIRSLYAECQRLTWDKTFQTKELFKGTAKYLKAPGPGQGSRASLELYKQTAKGPSPTIYEKYICTGTYLYEFSESKKVIRVHQLPQAKTGQVADDNFLSFLFGMKALEAKQRYQLALTSTDQYYHYIQIQPRSDQDKSDFTTAQLVLRKDNFLPARVWFLQPNKNEVTWDFLAKADVQIPASVFEQPKLPPGWQLEPVPAEAKLKVRSNGP